MGEISQTLGVLFLEMSDKTFWWGDSLTLDKRSVVHDCLLSHDASGLTRESTFPVYNFTDK